MEQNKNVQDTVIIGGGAAGLTAAMVLARAYFNVTIIDNGKQSNLASANAHGVFTRENAKPIELYKSAQAQLKKYPTARIINSKVIDIESKNGEFISKLPNNEVITSKTVLLAQGVNYQLPNIQGLKELWGKKVWHCPYCHGYESSGKDILAILEPKKIENMRHLLPHWKLNVTYKQPDEVKEIIDKQSGVKVIFTDNSSCEFDEILTQTQHQQHDDLAQKLGCKINNHGILEIDNNHMTNIDGVYSAGDQSSAIQQVNLAVASGHLAAVAITHRQV